MRKKLIYNYWLIIVAWCMFLNHKTMLAYLLGIGACLVLLLINRRVNYWRMAFLTVIVYVLVSFILSNTNIPYFFPKLYIFTALISLDVAFTFERLYLFKSKYLKPFLACMLVSIVVLSLIAFLLPDKLYSLFTKKSLLIMIYLIFLPYCATLSYCLIYKKIKDSTRYKRILADIVPLISKYNKI